MKSKFLGIMCCLLLASIGSVSLYAQDDMMMDAMSSELLIGNVWARPTNFQPMEGMDMDMSDDTEMDDNMEMETTPDAEIPIPPSAVYMSITNTSDTDYRLIEANTPGADEVQIHETTVTDDVMRMRELQDGLLIASGQTAVLEQGGLHIMLLGLANDLLPGDALPLTLTFAIVADGEVTDDTFTRLIGAPILEEAPERNDDIYVTNAWARATLFGEMGGMDMAESTPDPNVAIPPSAIYMTMLNLSNTDETLIEVRTPVSMMTQIHETTIEDDVMRMSELEDGLALPAGESAVLEQGGNHVMLMGLERDLIADNAITAILVFESGLEIIIGVPVLESAMMDMDG